MGYTNYWTINKTDKLPDEYINKIKDLITFYKQKHNITNIKLFCELLCDSISCNPNFYIIDLVIKNPYSDDTKTLLLKYENDVEIFLKCMVEYFISIKPNIKELIQNNDIKKIIDDIPQYPLQTYSNQDILKRTFNDIYHFTSYMYFLYRFKHINIINDNLENIYFNKYLTFNGTLNEFIKSQIDITDDELKEFRQRNDYFVINDPFKYINGYDKTDFNLNYDLIKFIINNYPNLTTEDINSLIENNTEDIYNIISYTFYLLKNTYWNFNDDKQYYIRVKELNENNIFIISCYEPIDTTNTFCKTARYGYDSLVKTFIILSGYYDVFSKWWNTDDNYELKCRLSEIQEYLNYIGFEIDKLYDSENKYGYYGIDKEIEKVDNDNETGIYIEIKKIN